MIPLKDADVAGLQDDPRYSNHVKDQARSQGSIPSCGVVAGVQQSAGTCLAHTSPTCCEILAARLPWYGAWPPIPAETGTPRTAGSSPMI
eukprot:350033-Chlamydomonas_euryale.AAC.4